MTLSTTYARHRSPTERGADEPARFLESYRYHRSRGMTAIDALRWVRYYSPAVRDAREKGSAERGWADWFAGGWRGARAA